MVAEAMRQLRMFELEGERRRLVMQRLGSKRQQHIGSEGELQRVYEAQAGGVLANLLPWPPRGGSMRGMGIEGGSAKGGQQWRHTPFVPLLCGVELWDGGKAGHAGHGRWTRCNQRPLRRTPLYQFPQEAGMQADQRGHTLCA